MELNTASSVISFVSELEQRSADFYGKWAERHTALKNRFDEFVKENQKTEKNIKRSYYSVVTDALETNFCFKGLTAKAEIPDLPENASAEDVVRASVEMEKFIRDFYRQAADLSRSLLADVPRAMDRVARNRDSRISELEKMA